MYNYDVAMAKLADEMKQFEDIRASMWALAYEWLELTDTLQKKTNPELEECENVL